MSSRPPSRPLRPRPALSRVGQLLHRLQEDLLTRWQFELEETGGILGPELRRYRATYERDFERAWDESSPEELLGAVQGADVVFCGDHHLLGPAQRLLLRLLRRVEPAATPGTIALEMLHSRDQPLVDSFLAGRMDARLLRDAISYDTRWPFDWDAYAPLLELARRRHMRVLAINSEPGHPRASRLARRDAHAAERLMRCLAAEGSGRIFVLAGDWHMASRHLPARLAELASRRGRVLRRVIVHQNHDGLYRRLMSRLGRVPAVVRGGVDLFCVLNSTPLVKARAQLAWHGRRQRDDAPTPDSAAAFQDVARALVRHLGLDPALLDRVTPWEIENGHELAVAARLLGWNRVTRDRRWRRLRRGDVLHLRRRRLLLLHHPPLNRLAEAAAALLGGGNTPPAGGTPRERALIRFVESGTQFFATRLINPRRKCDLLEDLRQAPSSGDAAAIWAGVLLRGVAAPRSGSAFWRRGPRELSGAARRVGLAWGYTLYENYEAGRLSSSHIRRLFAAAAAPESIPGLVCRSLPGRRGNSDPSSKRDLL